MAQIQYCTLATPGGPPEHLAMAKARKPQRRTNFIREWRRFRDNMSQEELAERAGMSPGNLSQIETGRISYTSDSLQRLAEALDCTKGELLDVDPFKLDDLDLLARNGLSGEQRRMIADLAQVMLKSEKSRL